MLREYFYRTLCAAPPSPRPPCGTPSAFTLGAKLGRSGSPLQAAVSVSAKPLSMAGPWRDMRSFAQKASGLQRMRPVLDTWRAERPSQHFYMDGPSMCRS